MKEKAFARYLQTKAPALDDVLIMDGWNKIWIKLFKESKMEMIEDYFDKCMNEGEVYNLFEQHVEGKSFFLDHYMKDSAVTVTIDVFNVLTPEQRAKLVTQFDHLCELREDLHLD